MFDRLIKRGVKWMRERRMKNSGNPAEIKKKRYFLTQAEVIRCFVNMLERTDLANHYTISPLTDREDK